MITSRLQSPSFFSISNSKHGSLLLWLVILSLVLNSCLPSDPTFNEKVVTEEAAEVFNQYLETVNSGNTNDIPTYFSDDPRFYWIEDGLKVYGDKHAMVTSLERFTENVSEVSMQTDELIITPISSEIASLFTSYNQRLRFANGYEMELEGAITITLKKEAGKWKFLDGHSSTKKPRGS